MLPMLAPRQVVFWTELKAIEKGEKSRESKVKRLAEYLDNPAPFTVLVLEAEQLDARMRLFKLLSEKLIVVTCELDGETFRTHRRGRDHGCGDGARIRRANGSRSRAESGRKDKCRACTNPHRIGETCHICRRPETNYARGRGGAGGFRSTIFSLGTSGMLAAGDRPRAMLFLESLFREGEQPVGIVGAMAWMFRKLIEVQELPRGATTWDAARLGMRKDTAELALKYAPRIPRRAVDDRGAVACRGR